MSDCRARCGLVKVLVPFSMLIAATRAMQWLAMQEVRCLAI
jgi:hypothetical protein